MIRARWIQPNGRLERPDRAVVVPHVVAQDDAEDLLSLDEVRVKLNGPATGRKGGAEVTVTVESCPEVAVEERVARIQPNGIPERLDRAVVVSKAKQG